MRFIMHSKPGCVQCNMTSQRIKNKGGEVEVVAADADFEAYFGSRQLPGVIAMNEDGTAREIWTGFRPDKIDSYL